MSRDVTVTAMHVTEKGYSHTICPWMNSLRRRLKRTDRTTAIQAKCHRLIRVSVKRKVGMFYSTWCRSSGRHVRSEGKEPEGKCQGSARHPVGSWSRKDDRV